MEMYNTGDTNLPAETRAIIEHVLADRPGTGGFSIVGSQASDRWEMKISGPYGFERSYTLEGATGEHEPSVIGSIFSRMVAILGQVER